LHPEDHERVLQGLRAYLAEPGPGYETEYRLRHQDGTYRWMLARAELMRDGAGRLHQLLGCQLDLTERKAAEGACARLAAIVESSEDAIIGKTLEGIVTDWNEGARRLFGYAAQEMVGQPIARLIPPDRLEEEAQILARLRRGERVEPYETVRRRKDGRLIDVSLSISPLRDASGRIVGASKIVRDITERKAAEAAARQAEGQLREQAALLELAPVLVRDLDGRIVLWTHGAERLYGFSKDEALGRVSHELFQTRFPDSRERVDQALREVGRWEGELVHRTRGGERRVVASQQIVYRDARGRPARILEVNADVTERKRAEQALRDSQARLAGVLDSAMDAIISIDEAQRVVLFNAAAERVFGCPAAEALGQSLKRFIPERFRAAHAAHVRAFGQTGVTSRAMGKLGELSGLRADGQEFPIEASISQTTVGGAKLFTVILRDITARKAAEAALSRSQEELRALAARLQQAREEEAVRLARELHDQLGRCLTTVKLDVGGVERALRGGVQDESARSRLLEAAQRMGQALDETVQTVRRLSAELRPGVLDDLGLAAAIDWQAKDFQKRSGVACVLRLPEEDPPLSREQATALFRIFQEALTNVARHAQARTVWVYLAEEEGHVVLEVEDDGVGLSPAALTERRSLGLLGMRERAAAFGGTVEVTGCPGQGVTVLVRLPVGGARD
jgi:PAS domain S-box-containing protein